jgi:hypothetical protein
MVGNFHVFFQTRRDEICDGTSFHIALGESAAFVKSASHSEAFGSDFSFIDVNLVEESKPNTP